MFQQLLERIGRLGPRQRRTAIGPLHGSSAAALLAELARAGGVLAAIAPDSLGASQLLRELRFYARASGVEILSFPDWETLPYDHFSPHQDILSERLHTLYRLPRLESGVLVAPVPTLMHRLAPPSHVAGGSLVLDVGQSLAVEPFRRNLERCGYRQVETVFERGEYALRGSLLDIFPMGGGRPYRIDLFDEEVASLRSFDPETQRTVSRVDNVRLLPAREFSLDEEAVQRFQDNWLREFDVDHDACPMFSGVAAGRPPGGSEYYLPLFHERCASLFDYLPERCQLLAIGDHRRAARSFWGEVEERYREYGIDPRRPLLPPRRVFLPVDELYRNLRARSLLELRLDAAAPVHIASGLEPCPDLTPADRGPPAARLAEFIAAHDGPVLICAESEGRRQTLLESLAAQGLRPPLAEGWREFLDSGERLAIATAPIDRGLYWGPGRPTLVAEAQMFGDRVAQRRRRAGDKARAAMVRDINELQPGVAVVHLEHGVGRYEGLQTLEVDGQSSEFLSLRYAGDSRLHVPVASLHLISRYSGGDPELAPLHRLGGEQWRKARRKAAEKVSDVAAELLAAHARRAARPGRACELPREAYQRFAAEFSFEETPDQARAIAAVLDDMRAERAMDRLICGDVGFGKTEVAMRAAFVAVQNGRQVAMLVPTTLLAQQHFSSLRDRFADWPVTVEVISRFRSGAEQEAILERVASGRVDILIGTHKLLRSDIEYRDLGLLIIDEEHRFGVRQKEAVESLRAAVDILTLTATPIPRTLNMALGGLRDMSIIATPPARRLSIRTFVHEHDIALIKEAVTREVLRGGQVYYLHNEVRTIEERARKLGELLPGLRIGVAHGQLHERQLERVMSAFYHQRYQVLLCSTIIETGIDVPNANTIVIERADRFGLAQLHQLRGRVGRSHHQAYAYLLCPPRAAMTADAERRLAAIESSGELGAGYLLATRDLEIRGAGELLGREQSGQIHSVGFALYTDMLGRAVDSLRRGELPDPEGAASHPTELDLRAPALIPDAWLPDIGTRLVLYKRIAAAATDAELQDLQAEMADRFGPLPPQTRTLFQATALRLRAASLGIRRIDAGERGGLVEFADDTPVEPLELARLVQAEPRVYRLTGGSRLRFDAALPELRGRLEFVERLLRAMAAGCAREAAA